MCIYGFYIEIKDIKVFICRKIRNKIIGRKEKIRVLIIIVVVLSVLFFLVNFFIFFIGIC